MSIDLSQFHQIFFEESFEGLDVMEQQLVQLEHGTEDLEAINSIFRAAHSIKGGSGTFGFQQVADFTHVVESLLDEMRTGERKVTQEALDLLLSTVDVLRSMLVALQNHQEIDKQGVADCHEKLLQFEKGESGIESNINQKVETKEQNQTASKSKNSWNIGFKELHGILLTGNEPSRMFRELENLGTLYVTIDDTQLPSFEMLDPETLYLSWDLILESDCELSEIQEVFEWVVDDCVITITQSPKCLISDQESESIDELHDDNSRAQKENNPTATQSLESSLINTEQKSSASGSIEPGSKEESSTESSSIKKAPANRSIRVDIHKVDELINRVGELVITQSMLAELGHNMTLESIEKLRAGLTQLEQNTRELQESVMGIRMLPISFAFNRFPRLVRDVSQQLGKEVNLVVKGENTELDKTVMEQISDPLVHIVRNSLDHGFEKPQERIENGKQKEGTLTLSAYHQGGEIVIEISDDGRGLDRKRIIDIAKEKGLIHNEELSDEQVWQLIFEPGFSTAKEVSDLSGRGVGMDVVKRNITGLGGSVDMFSAKGKGTKILIRLPLTLAILDGQLIRVGSEIYIVPLMAMVESLVLNKSSIKTMGNNGEMHQLREQFIPLLDLKKILKMQSDPRLESKEKLLLVAESEGSQYGLIIDDLLTQQQVVVKSLDANFRTIPGISGATILGNGRVALILDIAGIVRRSKSVKKDFQNV